MKARIIIQKSHWEWNEGNIQAHSSCSMFSFESNSGEHVSLESQPPGRRFHRVPSAFMKVRNTLLGLIMKRNLKRVELNLSCENQVFPKRKHRRTWEIHLVPLDLELEPAFLYVGKAPDMGAIKRVLRELTIPRELDQLKKMDAPLLIHAGHLPFLSVDLKHQILSKCSFQQPGRPGEAPYHFLFQDPRRGMILHKSNELFSWRGPLPKQMVVVSWNKCGVSSGRLLKPLIGGAPDDAME